MSSSPAALSTTDGIGDDKAARVAAILALAGGVAWVMVDSEKELKASGLDAAVA